MQKKRSISSAVTAAIIIMHPMQCGVSGVYSKVAFVGLTIIYELPCGEIYRIFFHKVRSSPGQLLLIVAQL